jgi:threonine synthase
MRYISTRGEAPPVSFTDALMIGLARDGGLYMPEAWPVLSREMIASFAGRPYADVAFEVIRPLIGGGIADADLNRMIREAYAAFDRPEVAPLHDLGANEFILELFHGPTLAFKDIAMQLVARMMDHVLAQRGERATVIAATSGDTGGAAVEAFRGRKRTDVVVLFPKGRVSDVQRRMITTAADANVHALAIDGTFDDCQAIVKAMFNDQAFRERVKLSSVNSINWARIVAQAVYYFTAAAALGAPAKTVTFVVPTGNFGDIFAGYAAKRMGLPAERLVIATNVNDILARTLASGRYEPRGVLATQSPAMDIQVSSNFERLLFEAYGREATPVRALMQALADEKGFTIGRVALDAIRADFEAGRADEDETRATIRDVHRMSGYLLDPHGAVGLAVARKRGHRGRSPVVVLGTAHPAKFPDAVEAATGFRPQLPASLANLMTLPERVTALPADKEKIVKVITEKSRAAISGAIA